MDRRALLAGLAAMGVMGTAAQDEGTPELSVVQGPAMLAREMIEAIFGTGDLGVVESYFDQERVNVTDSFGEVAGVQVGYQQEGAEITTDIVFAVGNETFGASYATVTVEGREDRDVFFAIRVDPDTGLVVWYRWMRQ